MKFTTLIAAAALAVASTAATAQNVTTDAGELVIVEKNQVGSLALLIQIAGPAAVAGFIAAVVSSEGTK